MLLTFRLLAHFNHLTAAVTSTAFADVMREHQLAALQTGHQRRCVEALMLAPVAAAVARNFCLRYGSHVDDLLLISGVQSHDTYCVSQVIGVRRDSPLVTVPRVDYSFSSSALSAANRSSLSSFWQPQSSILRSAPQVGQIPLQSGLQSGCIGNSSSVYSRMASPRSTR